jgi:hypothetical protein
VFADLPSVQWAAEETESAPGDALGVHAALREQVKVWQDRLEAGANIGLRKSIKRKLKAFEAHAPVLNFVADLEAIRRDAALFPQTDLWEDDTKAKLGELSEEHSGQLTPIYRQLVAQARSGAPSGEVAPPPAAPLPPSSPEPSSSPPPPPPAAAPSPTTVDGVVIGWVLERPAHRQRILLALGNCLPLGRNPKSVPHAFTQFHKGQIKADPNHPVRGVSGLHCRLFWLDRELMIADGDGQRGSTNGTRLQGETLPENKVTPLDLKTVAESRLHLHTLPVWVKRENKTTASLRWRIGDTDERCIWSSQKILLQSGGMNGLPQIHQGENEPDLTLEIDAGGAQIRTGTGVNSHVLSGAPENYQAGYRLNWKGQTWILYQFGAIPTLS